MEPSVFNPLTTFLSNHFEFIIYINVSLALLFLIGWFGVKLSDADTRKIYYSRFRAFLMTFILGGQVFFFVVLILVYWKNYEKPAPQIPTIGDALASTWWVKDDFKLYFIEGNQLRTVRVNGSDSEDVFTGETDVMRYVFSPNGKYICVVTENALYLIHRKTKEETLIDRLFTPEQLAKKDSGAISGSIGNIQWSPDSKKFVYELARWSKFASQDQVHIYDTTDGSKQSINSPTRKISSLYWGLEDGQLYFIRHQAGDPSAGEEPFEVRVYRIPLTTMTPEYVASIPNEDFSVPIENLNFRGIQLYFGGSKYSFGPSAKSEQISSENGAVIGVDEDDYLYVINSRWFRKRLYKIPREESDDGSHRYQYKGGDLIIDHIKWLPGNRYVIMEHKYWGVVILEPSSGKLGLLIQANGHTFGWYP